MSARAVFLDRDGVINAVVLRDGIPYPPASADELEILPGVPEALQELKHAGYLLVVVTNQPDVPRGRQAREVVDEIHQRLRSTLPLDAIYCCFHDDPDRCRCRKPAPGLLFDAAALHDIDLASSFMIGDRWRDTEAGIAAGCQTVFIDRGYRERRPEVFDIAVSTLDEACAWILAGGAT